MARRFRGSTRVDWLDEGYAQTREALDRCSLDLALELSETNGFTDEATAGEILFFDGPEAEVIRSTLVEGATGSIAIYTIHNKGQIDWWHVKVTGVEDLPGSSEAAYPRFRITLTTT